MTVGYKDYYAVLGADRGATQDEIKCGAYGRFQVFALCTMLAHQIFLND